VLAGKSALPIGWTGERHADRCARDTVRYFSRISDRVHVHVARTLKRIHGNPAARADPQSRLGRERNIWTHANCENNDVGGNDATVFDFNGGDEPILRVQ
jgi:hypothetical protein